MDDIKFRSMNEEHLKRLLCFPDDCWQNQFRKRLIEDFQRLKDDPIENTIDKEIRSLKTYEEVSIYLKSKRREYKRIIRRMNKIWAEGPLTARRAVRNGKLHEDEEMMIVFFHAIRREVQRRRAIVEDEIEDYGKGFVPSYRGRRLNKVSAKRSPKSSVELLIWKGAQIQLVRLFDCLHERHLIDHGQYGRISALISKHFVQKDGSMIEQKTLRQLVYQDKLRGGSASGDTGITGAVDNATGGQKKRPGRSTSYSNSNHSKR